MSVPVMHVAFHSRFAGLLLVITVLFIFPSCRQSASTETNRQDTSSIQFRTLSPEETGITFANTIQDEGRVNIFTWHFIYNGAGVAAGDINNDGLADLFFTGNQVADQLYLNKGNFQFENITAAANIHSTDWSSGVTMADVNADGWLDIYICKNSPTGLHEKNKNLLYINQGNNTFAEQGALFGLDDIGFSSQATFFDLDQDGDLDMYLVNQPFDEFARLVNKPEVVAGYPETDRLYINENGKFTDKTAEYGLLNARYGLNVSIADFDLNGWTDLYICNDYHHGDHLYLNHNGRLREAIHERTGHTSFYSMGSDAGDINADGWPDLFTLDMAYEDHYRSKTNMGSMDVDWFWNLVEQGNHYQYMQNVLQVNTGYGYFSDMAQSAGIAKSDWSFSTLLADLDNDADQDILVTNGVLRDLRNNDFNKMVRERYQNRVGPDNYLEVLKNLPSTPVPNIVYRNDGKMQFSKLPAAAGFSEPGFSHGMAYADLNNDGLLDVIVNNENAPATIYKNEGNDTGHFLNIKLKGPASNTDGLGSTVILYHGSSRQVNTMQTTRGYFSSVPPILHFGLGDIDKIDSVQIIWDHKSMTVLKNVSVDQKLEIQFAKEKKIPFVNPQPQGIVASAVAIAADAHSETAWNDYQTQVLIPYKLSQLGPFLCIDDINGDKREDIFIGGSAGFPGQLLTQQSDGSFTRTNQSALLADKAAEDLGAQFTDFEGDGDMDLIVVSGSSEFEDTDQRLLPRLYVNDGSGNFSKASSTLFPQQPVNGQCITLIDADGDKDDDILIGGRQVAGKYAVSASSRLWINHGGQWKDETALRAPDLDNIGMVTAIVTLDADTDGDDDFVVTGEWMTPILMINDGKGNFSSQPITAAGQGLWWSAAVADFDADGDPDLLFGNLGWNNKFGGSRGTKLEVYASDFDNSGDFDVVLASTKNDALLPVRGRECTSQEMPYIAEKFPTYEGYAKAQLQDIYTPEQLQQSAHKKLSTMSSIYLRNDGAGKWVATDLPITCQMGPVKAMLPADVNGDQQMDFLYAGNHYPTEVETARYDGLFPGICLGDGKGNFTCQTLFIDNKPLTGDFRAIEMLTSPSGNAVYLMTRNNGSVSGLRVQK